MSLGAGAAFAEEIEHMGGLIPPELMKGGAGEVAVEPTMDKIGIKTAPAPNAHTVWIYDPAAFDVVTKIYRVNGDTGFVEGEIDTGLLTNTVLAPDQSEVYIAETWYSRFAAGTRDDFVRCQDPRTLTTTCDFDIPEGRFLVMVMNQMTDITTDGRYLLYYQFSPAPGVGVADLKNKKFVSTIDIPDCYLVFPSGPRSFVMHCRDGTLLNASFDESGKAKLSQTTAFRADDEHIIDTPAFSRTAGKIFFVAYDGSVYPVDISSGQAKVGKSWEMFTEAEHHEGWNPGGWAPLAYHRESDRLFVLADIRAEWTHIYASSHVLVYKASTGKRIDDITLVHAALSINVSQDGSPLLYALDNHTAQLFVYDANTGRYLHTVDEMGHDPYIIVTPSPCHSGVTRRP
jgi:methylamine dehydrogenase heavy chain